MKNNLRKTINYLNPYNVSGEEPNAQRDWIILLAFFVICLLGGAFIGVYVYFNMANAVSKEIVLPENSVVSISKASIKDVVDDIKDKEKKFNDGFMIETLRDPSR